MKDIFKILSLCRKYNILENIILKPMSFTFLFNLNILVYYYNG